jgi:hypothetical protein
MADLVRVEGARELEASMHAAADSLAHLDTAGTQAGARLVTVAKTLAPRVSGRLANSIRAERAATSVTVTAGGTTVPYAGPIHWGWAARNIAAQPFLTDALAQASPQITADYARDVAQTVSTIHGK